MNHKKQRFSLARLHQILYPQPTELSLAEYQALPARIAHVSRLLNQAHDLPYVSPCPTDRRRHGGQIFERAPELVDAVVASLRRDPDAFPGYPHTGEEIAAHQAAADSWRGYASHLFGLAFAAYKTYLHEQSRAVSMARAYVDKASALLQHPELFPSGKFTYLNDLLRHPRLILEQVRGEQVERRRAALGDAAPKDPKRKRARATSPEAEASFWAGFVRAGLQALRQLAQAPRPDPTDFTGPTPEGPPPAPVVSSDAADAGTQGTEQEILTRFLKDRLGLDPGAPQGPRLPSLQDLAAAHEILLAQEDGLVSLDETTRARLRPHQNEMAPELLDECAGGLRRFPALGAEIGADAEVLLHLAGQGTAIGGMAKGWERCHEALDLGGLLLAEEAERELERVDDALREAMATLPPGKWAALANLFGDAIRLRMQIQADRQGGDPASPQAAQARRQIEKLREDFDRAEQVGRFLAAVENGEI
jgi:hypothetical protein